MDPATHALTGLCIARSLPRSVRGRDTTLLVVAASLLPDIDVLWSLYEPATVALDRHLLTHSLIGLALLSGGVGVLAWLLWRRLPLIVYVMLVLLAMIGHIGLDLINAYGVALLYPWSMHRFEVPLAFIIDPVLTEILLAGLLAPLIFRHPAWATPMSRAALLLVGCYLAACFSLRVAAENIIEARASMAGSDHWTYLFPELGSPLQWMGIYRDGDSYRQLVVFPLSGGAIEYGSVRSTPDDPLVSAVRTDGDRTACRWVFQSAGLARRWRHGHCLRFALSFRRARQ